MTAATGFQGRGFSEGVADGIAGTSPTAADTVMTTTGVLNGMIGTTGDSTDGAMKVDTRTAADLRGGVEIAADIATSVDTANPR